MLRRFAWGILLPLIGACSLFTSFDGASGGERPSSAPEGGVDETVGDGAAGLANGDAAPLEGGADTDGGCIRRPSSIVDRTPVGSAGFTCDLANAVELDGKFAGLDNTPGSAGKIGSENVTSCLEARFDGDIGARIVVHAMVKESACGGACTGGCEGDPLLKVFAGASNTTLEYLGLVKVDRAAGLAPYTVFRAGGDAARVVVVCRGTTSSYVDAVIDIVTADCR